VKENVPTKFTTYNRSSYLVTYSKPATFTQIGLDLSAVDNVSKGRSIGAKHQRLRS
jgi:hypothetical protein